MGRRLVTWLLFQWWLGNLVSPLIELGVDALSAGCLLGGAWLWQYAGTLR